MLWRARLAFMLVSPACLCVLTGCDPGREEDAPPRTTADSTTPNANPARPEAQAPRKSPAAQPRAVPETAGEEVDLIGDRPDAKTDDKKKTAVLMEDIEPTGPLVEKARLCYGLIAKMKTNLDSIAKDLDAGGKEITRLIRTSDALSTNINELADLWAGDEEFRDVCGVAKVRSLALNDELSRVPRKWPNIRWSFNGAVREVRKLRLRARDMAEAEPKPVAVTGKDGKVTYVEPEGPPVDPRVVRRENKRQEVEEARRRIKNAEEARKKKEMPIDLDGN